MCTRVTLLHIFAAIWKVLNLDLLCVELQLEQKKGSKRAEPHVAVIPFTLDHSY